MAKKILNAITVYGIPNCDSVKKAFNWLKEHQISYKFYDYKKNGITKVKLNKWCNYFGWENVINKNGTTWRELSDDEKNTAIDQASAITLMLEKTSLIKRPIIEAKGKYLIRFNDQQYSDVLLKR